MNSCLFLTAAPLSDQAPMPQTPLAEMQSTTCACGRQSSGPLMKIVNLNDASWIALCPIAKPGGWVWIVTMCVTKIDCWAGLRPGCDWWPRLVSGCSL